MRARAGFAVSTSSALSVSFAGPVGRHACCRCDRVGVSPASIAWAGPGPSLRAVLVALKGLPARPAELPYRPLDRFLRIVLAQCGGSRAGAFAPDGWCSMPATENRSSLTTKQFLNWGASVSSRLSSTRGPCPQAGLGLARLDPLGFLRGTSPGSRLVALCSGK
jgi:hypothetical protein